MCGIFGNEQCQGIVDTTLSNERVKGILDCEVEGRKLGPYVQPAARLVHRGGEVSANFRVLVGDVLDDEGTIGDHHVDLHCSGTGGLL